MTKKLIVSIVTFLTITACAACGTPESEQHFVSNKYSLIMPSLWVKTSGFNQNSAIELYSAVKEACVIILAENKSDLKASLKKTDVDLVYYSNLSLGFLLKNMENSKVISSPKKITTRGGLKAVQSVIQGTLNNLEMRYILTSIETPEHYLQVSTWTRTARFAASEKDFYSIINSIRTRK